MLKRLNQVGDIKKLSLEQLPELAIEIRTFLIDSTQKTGGHLSSNLGVVELTIALHYLLDLPKDEIVWDVSHQSYVHKILTERKNKMTTIRQAGGLSGFAKIKESIYDSFGAGHASTSISAALGIALAKRLNGDGGLVVPVIGDGAMTGGMAFEALNNASMNPNSNVLIILNDNKMSISENVGGIVKTLAHLINSAPYQHFRNTSKKLLKTTSLELLNFAKKGEDRLKEMAFGSNLFEQLGIDYTGVVDGHDIPSLIRAISDMKDKTGVRLLHIRTQKGKGIAEAEADPLKYHGVKAQSATKSVNLNEPKKLSYSEVLGEWLCHQAKKNPKLIGVTPAMCQGSGMDKFAVQFPNQFFDVGIAEQHALTFCAGFAAKGEKPVLAIYSTFLQRAYDQLIHDASVQELNITLAIDRAGIVGEDGPTHSGQFDLSYLRILPKIVVMTPSDELEMVQMLNTAYAYEGVAAVRYPKGNSKLNITQQAIEAEIAKERKIELGKANIIREAEGSKAKRKQLALLVFGDLLFEAQQLAEELDATLVNMRFVKPLDESLIFKLIETHHGLVTVEENTISGGAGSAVSELLTKHNKTIPIKHLGISDEYVDQGQRQTLLSEMGLDARGMKQTIETWIKAISN